MKTTLLFFFLASIFFFDNTQTIKPAPKGKAVVYFVRSSSLGSAINFTYFDSTKVIGRFNGPKYLRYECQPGKHLFWVRSENKDYIKADLESGKIYVIDVVPQMGAIKASVRLIPVNSEDYRMKKIKKLISKKDSESFSQKELTTLQIKMEDVINRSLKKYKNLKIPVKKLGTFTFKPEDLLFVKKKKE
ncbi:hypothetical protein [Aureibacter tunicatorum]|uniref:DUF2846 domain-containing protein n=1 Tax=Aureibacter tunicatorum TaxID=866807 RepID=A0AAE3XNW5_9BACT|nr:hypothetical protein [Aureibacter tunicatorum]MDR6238549.1 hypothetical protein [Aureibacter tunicatorum]BDD05520.1 hypothetical protein AUTU_30030 [Aureibacter tunicatorum]